MLPIPFLSIPQHHALNVDNQKLNMFLLLATFSSVHELKKNLNFWSVIFISILKLTSSINTSVTVLEGNCEKSVIS